MTVKSSIFAKCAPARRSLLVLAAEGTKSQYVTLLQVGRRAPEVSPAALILDAVVALNEALSTQGLGRNMDVPELMIRPAVPPGTFCKKDKPLLRRAVEQVLACLSPAGQRIGATVVGRRRYGSSQIRGRRNDRACKWSEKASKLRGAYASGVGVHQPGPSVDTMVKSPRRREEKPTGKPPGSRR